MSTVSTQQSQSITGVILAGGLNSRMQGRNKALLIWRQRTFIEHIIERLRPQVEQLAINSNQPQLFQSLHLPVIADPFSDQRGPLAGILAGLNHSTTQFTLFAPCDNPLPSPELTARLYASLQQYNADIAFAGTRAGDHYLYALIRTQLGASLQQFLQHGARAVRHWYADHNCCRVDFDDQLECFANINTEADLSRLTQ